MVRGSTAIVKDIHTGKPNSKLISANHKGPYIAWFHLNEMSTIGKSIKVENRLVAA